ncbi:hypothetical protein LOZ51_005240 [Ophidiomyces ophidiicola]|nr:hypothetical protein LOZ55_005974 [Ophidiomyces ophidiicola]KAI1978051.1 hypothetical protein LOZ54_006369 [Ophidiomyces ophidiicola]KAI1988853.1 hypothetical protein LOZ51_005240 [Ophidiomyces ophidiicola]
MAQTQPQQFPAQPFSPPASSPSPSSAAPPSNTTANLGPPPKRQRLSPLPQPQPPFAAAGFGTLQLSQNGSPVNGVSANGMAASATLNTPAPPGSMGPPSRPVDTKPTDAAELTDVLASSGIDVREEEAFLTSGYAAAAITTSQPARLLINPSTSFTSIQSAGSTVSPGNSFSDPAVKPSSYPTSTIPATLQPTLQQSPEELDADTKLREDTIASRRDQYHLQASFLQTAPLGEKLQKRGAELGVRMPSAGFFRPFPNRPVAPIEIVGPDGHSVVRTGKPVLTTDAPLGDIIALVSLACEERVRSVVEHSAVLAKNRKAYSHGNVPPEWNDLAESNNRKSMENLNGVPNPSPQSSPQKRPTSTTDGRSNDTRKVTFPNTLAMKSRKLIEKDGLYEEGRATKRVKRNSDSILGVENGRTGPVGGLLSTAATPTDQADDRVPDSEKKTKKESKKSVSKANEPIQHRDVVQTARMATGGLTTSRFGGKKTYSWLTNSDATSASRTSFSNSSRTKGGAGSTLPGAGPPGTLSNGVRAPFGRRLGEWREDKERGSGVQIRDILFMLEVDGKAAKHLQKAYSKESKEDVDRPGK